MPSQRLEDTLRLPRNCPGKSATCIDPLIDLPATAVDGSVAATTPADRVAPPRCLRRHGDGQTVSGPGRGDGAHEPSGRQARQQTLSTDRCTGRKRLSETRILSQMALINSGRRCQSERSPGNPALERRCVARRNGCHSHDRVGSGRSATSLCELTNCRKCAKL